MTKAAPEVISVSYDGFDLKGRIHICRHLMIHSPCIIPLRPSVQAGELRVESAERTIAASAAHAAAAAAADQDQPLAEVRPFLHISPLDTVQPIMCVSSQPDRQQYGPACCLGLGLTMLTGGGVHLLQSHAACSRPFTHVPSLWSHGCLRTMTCSQPNSLMGA